MLLSNADVGRLVRAGHRRQEFVFYDKHGYANLRNNRGFCVFYDSMKSRCRVYEKRPSGCRIYPVIYIEQEGTTVDDLCPAKDTISEKELKRRSRKIKKLLQEMENEATQRKSFT
ncbi:MAG: YkgJ family cysteine cluster protein [Candidatus Bathyarchaeota archaeon]|nr:MAG: YkgJ family cysteine cluster protein [Candidatus Bathyarchaeota archaeon]